MKRRHEFYLDEDVSEQLASLARKPGGSKTAIMTTALRAYFDRRGTSELDDQFKARLDKLSLQSARIERDQQIVAESLALLAHFQFLHTPPVFNDDREARLGASERFKKFIAAVSQRISTGRTLIGDVLKQRTLTETKDEPQIPPAGDARPAQ
jgi:predicted transcriptional regulator